MKRSVIALAAAVIAFCSQPSLAAKHPAKPKPNAANVATHTPPQPYILPAQGTLTKDDLIGFGSQIAAFQPKDQFDTPPNGAAVYGRPFTVNLPIDISYDASTRLLHLALYPQRWDFDRSLYARGLSGWKQITGFAVKTDRRGEDMYKATNGFGATTTVAKANTTAVAFAHFVEGEAYNAPSGLPANGTHDWARSNYDYVIPFEPEGAREFVKNISAVITGVVDRLPDGRSVACGEDTHQPTYSAPYEEHSKTCFFVVNFKRIDFINSATGQRITGW